MNIEIKKSSKKSLAVLYKAYSLRLSTGQSEQRAITFQRSDRDINGFSENSIPELKKAGYISSDILGNIYLKDKAIIC